MSIRSKMINYYFKKGDKKRDHGLQTPPDIQRHNNILYGSHKKWHLLDVYYLKNTHKKLPVIIIIHGGGWVYGTKETYQYYGMDLARRGFIVVNFNYRLAPKHRFPAQLEDINRVIYWLHQHNDKYLFDLNHVYLIGDSAGANLTSLYTSFITDKTFQQQFDFHPYKGFKPQAIVLNCGLYDLEYLIENKKPSAKLLKDFLPKKTYLKSLDLANAIAYVNHQFPSVFLMTAVEDFLKDQSFLFEKKLNANHVNYTFKIYGSDKEKRYHDFQCNITDKIAEKCNDETCDFLRQF